MDSFEVGDPSPRKAKAYFLARPEGLSPPTKAAPASILISRKRGQSSRPDRIAAGPAMPRRLEMLPGPASDHHRKRHRHLGRTTAKTQTARASIQRDQWQWTGASTAKLYSDHGGRRSRWRAGRNEN